MIDKGLTLVEVLIAIVLASLIMLPIILLFGVAEKVTYKSTNEIIASNLALQKIEELKSRPFAELRTIIETNVPDPIDGPFVEAQFPREDNGIWNSPGVTYSREARLSFFPFVNPDVTSPDYELQKRRIRIRVIVHFIEILPGGEKREKNFEMATILGDETYNSGLNASFSFGLKP